MSESRDLDKTMTQEQQEMVARRQVLLTVDAEGRYVARTQVGTAMAVGATPRLALNALAGKA